jgi:tRNA (guanine-N7-)-methyltransferase
MTDDPRAAGAGAGARTLYGRRKGKKLRQHQADLISLELPRLALDVTRPIQDPCALFARRPEAIRVEIGFGGAEHLVHEASRNPQIGYIGCEPFLNGVAKLLAQVEERGLSNIRIHHGDAREALVRLPDASIDRVDVLYPDPWPKWRQRKRRFLSSANIVEIARVLRPGGALRFATDIDDYAGWTLARTIHDAAWRWEEAAAGARAWTTPWEGWPGTRYEAKALREGRPPVYLTFTRTDQPPSAP